jgi:signal transduction histidine kinase/ligand-binding sensor domain-containing protein/CheY-like chemotaxis protein
MPRPPSHITIGRQLERAKSTNYMPGPHSRIRSIALGVALAAAFVRPAAAQHYRFEEYQATAGLTSQVINSLYEDRAGFLWLATNNGLFRFDGHQSVRFSEQDGLPHADILTVAQSPDGVLWVGTWGGLAWSKGGGKFVAAREPALKVPIFTQGISVAADGKVYVGTKKGIAELSKPMADGSVAMRVSESPAGPDMIVHGVLAALDGNVYFSCGTALCKLHEGRVSSWGEREGLPADKLQRYDAIRMDREGALLARSRSGLFRLAPGAAKFERVPASFVPPIYNPYPTLTVLGDQIAVPTFRGLALSSEKPSSEKPSPGISWRMISTRNGLPVDDVTSVLEDRSGALWVGTSGAGLLRWPEYKQWESFTPADGLAGTWVSQIASDPKQRIWAGTLAGLTVGERGDDGWKFRPYPLPKIDQVRDLLVDRDGNLWVTSEEPFLTRISLNGVRTDFGPVDGTGANLIQAPNGVLWVATTKGLFSLDASQPGARPVRHFPRGENVSETWCYSVAATDSGEIWVGGISGLYRRFPDGRWKTYNTKDGMLANIVGSMTKSPDGSIYMVYYQPEPIAVLRPGSGDSLKFESLQVGAPGETVPQVRSLSFDSSGRLWAFTDRGIRVREGSSWRSLTAANGLLWDETGMGPFLEYPRGQYWLGTIRGVSHYVPGAPEPPAVPLLQQVTAAGTSQYPSSDDSLKLRTESIVMRLTASPYRPDLAFRYRVDGRGDWMLAADGQILLPHVGSGRHSVEAQVRAGDGPWGASARVASLDLNLPWPVWAWALLAGVPVLIASAVVLFSWRLRKAERQRDQLEKTVAERTRELSGLNADLRREIEDRERTTLEKDQLEERLHEARKIEAVGRLAAGVAHDFNNLLNVINGFSSLAISELGPEHPQTEQVRHVLKAGQEAAGLVRQLLAAGRQPQFSVEPIDVNQAVEASREKLERALGDPVRVEIVCGAVEPVTANADQVQRILAYLAANARDAMPAGGTFRIATSAEVFADKPARFAGRFAAGRYVRIAVSDTGCGMNETVQQRMFDPYFTTKGLAEASGLGLASTLGIVERLNGFITVFSELTAGTEINIFLPAAGAPAAEPQTGAAPARRGRILVVEDQDEVRTFVRYVLVSDGHTVFTAESPTEALTLCEAEQLPVDLLVTDVVMPAMSGPKLAERIRATCGEVKVLYISGYPNHELSAQAVSNGDVAFVAKPFSPAALSAKVRELLNGG